MRWILLLLFLAACAAEPQLPEPPAPAPVPEPEPEALPEPPEQEPEMNEEIQQILDLSESKTRSMVYNYIGPGDIGPGHKYLVKAEKIKVEKQRPLELRDKENYFDAVYLDRASRTAVAYCEDIYEKRDCLASKAPFPVEFGEWDRPTPKDWIEEVEVDAYITGVEQFDNRDVTRIEFSKDGSVWAMLLDDKYGVPLKVEAGDKEYVYHNFIGNFVSDDEITP